jgi:hypothetical protein
MLNLNPYITKDKDIFYFDIEEYNSKNDISIENGDMIKFLYENKKYYAKAVALSNRKNEFFVLEILNFL